MNTMSELINFYILVQFIIFISQFSVLVKDESKCRGKKKHEAILLKRHKKTFKFPDNQTALDVQLHV